MRNDLTLARRAEAAAAPFLIHVWNETASDLGAFNVAAEGCN